jgi:hypothetical protein
MLKNSHFSAYSDEIVRAYMDWENENSPSLPPSPASLMHTFCCYYCKWIIRDIDISHQSNERKLVSLPDGEVGGREGERASVVDCPSVLLHCVVD